jgi:hypothetical protein
LWSRDNELNGQYATHVTPTNVVHQVKLFSEDQGSDISLKQVLHMIRYIVRSHRIKPAITTKQVFDSIGGTHCLQLLFPSLSTYQNKCMISTQTLAAIKCYDNKLTDSQFNSLHNAFAFKTSVIQGTVTNLLYVYYVKYYYVL